MSNKDKAPTWDSILSISICGLIAVIAVLVASSWLQKPSYVKNLVADYESSAIVSPSEMSESDVVSDTDISESTEVSASDTTSADTTSTSATAETEPDTKYLVITVRRAVMRESNSADSERITSIRSGQVVEMLEKKGSWYKIKYMNLIGWVHKNCAEEYDG